MSSIRRITTTDATALKRIIASAAFCVAFSMISNIECIPTSPRGAYRPHHFEDVTQALNHANRFFSEQWKQEDKCKRYAIILHEFQQGRFPDDVEVAQIAMSKGQDLQRRYHEINALALSHLYIDAMHFYRNTELAPPFLDLSYCLSQVNSVAGRTYLSEPELRTLLSQYRAVLSLPVSLVTRGCLSMDKYHPVIQKTLESFFKGYMQNERLCIGNFYAPLTMVPGGIKLRSKATMEPPSDNPPQPSQQAPVPQRPAPQRQAPVPQAAPQQVAHQPPVQQQPAQPQPQPQPQQQEPLIGTPFQDWQKDPELAATINAVIDDLVQSYVSSNESHSMEERCLAYNTLIDQEAKDNKEKLENFLFILRAFDPTDDDDLGTYIDLLDCAAQFDDTEEVIKAFLNERETKDVIQRAKITEVPAEGA